MMPTAVIETVPSIESASLSRTCTTCAGTSRAAQTIESSAGVRVTETNEPLAQAGKGASGARRAMAMRSPWIAKWNFWVVMGAENT